MQISHKKAFAALFAASLSLNLAASAFAADGALKKRSEIDPRYQWRLEDIYRTPAAWQKEWDSTKADGLALARFEGKLASSSKSLLEFMQAYEQVDIKLSKLHEYAERGSDLDTAVSSYGALLGKADTLNKDIGAATAFFTPEVSALSEPQLSEMIRQEPKLEPYRQTLSNIIRQGRHTLPKDQEALIADMGEVMGVPESAFGKLTDADLVFPNVRDERGKKVALSEARFLSLLDSEKQAVRRNAYISLLSTYQGVNNTLSSLMNGEVKAHVFERSVRHYPTSIAAALDSENIPVSVYDSLVSAVHEGLPSLYRYYALRKKILGLKELHPYDYNVPLVPGLQMNFPYEKAKLVINDALKPLGPDYLRVLNLGFRSRWVDVYENKGKRSGAYSASVYSVHPFVLQSYNGTYWDISTLAHEMGHAVNGYYSQTNNNYFNSDNPIFVAEVASQTNELLLMDYMLKNTKDKKARLFYLCQFADGIIGSIYRQTQYAEFEQAIHAKGDAGETLTPDVLNAAWSKVLKQYAGPSVTLDPVAKVGWSRIPHFYYNFYVYKYSTSYAAAMALSERILHDPSGKASADYVSFLKAGSTKYPVDLLKQAGVDLTTPEPVRTTLRKFDSIVREIETLSSQLKKG